MNQNLGQPGCSPRTVFAIHTLTKVYDSGPDCEPPAKITQAMFRGIEWKSGSEVWVNGVPYKAATRMCVKADHEKECEMMCVPKHLKALMANFVMGCCVHDEHDQEHEVAGNATRLGIVDLLSSLFPYFCKVC